MAKCVADYGRGTCTVHDAWWPLSDSQCTKAALPIGVSIELDPCPNCKHVHGEGEFVHRDWDDWEQKVITCYCNSYTQRNKIDNPDFVIDQRNDCFDFGLPHDLDVLSDLQYRTKREAVADHIAEYLKGDIIASGSGYERYRIYLALTNAIEHIFDLDFNNQ